MDNVLLEKIEEALCTSIEIEGQIVAPEVWPHTQYYKGIDSILDPTNLQVTIYQVSVNTPQDVLNISKIPGYISLVDPRIKDLVPQYNIEEAYQSKQRGMICTRLKNKE